MTNKPPTVRIDCDSISPTGCRLITAVATFPRFVLPQFLTHRMFSRNTSSSRAIRADRFASAVENDAYLPRVGAAKKGMSPGEELELGVQINFMRDCEKLLRHALDFHTHWRDKIHKQWINRYLEPWSSVTMIISATEWDNFFTLRCAEDAQSEIRQLAEALMSAIQVSVPQQLSVGDWHIPFIAPEERAWPLAQRLLVSTGRCARVSYLNHEGKRSIEDDLRLAQMIIVDRHSSPLEHQAQVLDLPYPKKTYQYCVKRRRLALQSRRTTRFWDRLIRSWEMAGIRANYYGFQQLRTYCEDYGAEAMSVIAEENSR